MEKEGTNKRAASSIKFWLADSVERGTRGLSREQRVSVVPEGGEEEKGECSTFFRATVCVVWGGVTREPDCCLIGPAHNTPPISANGIASVSCEVSHRTFKG